MKNDSSMMNNQIQKGGVAVLKQEVFLEQVVGKVQEQLQEGERVQVSQVEKVNQRLMGIQIVRAGEAISPTVYVEELFQQYRNGRSMEDLVLELLSISKESNSEIHSMADSLKAYEEVKQQLRVQLIHYEKNKEYLMQVPFEPFLDLARIVYLKYSYEHCEAQVVVTSQLLKKWGIGKEELFATGTKNTQQLEVLYLRSMRECVTELFQDSMGELESEGFAKELEQIPEEQECMYVISDQEKTRGAAWMGFDPQVLEQLAIKLKATTLYLLPSSRCEVIALPDFCGNVMELQEMVAEINQTQIADPDYLSDSVYRYDVNTGTIKIACSGSSGKERS